MHIFALHMKVIFVHGAFPMNLSHWPVTQYPGAPHKLARKIFATTISGCDNILPIQSKKIKMLFGVSQ